MRRIGAPATCPANGSRRIVVPDANGFLLVTGDRRQAWLVQDNYRIPLWDFACMARRGYPVWDWVETHELSAGGAPRPHPSIVATGCTG